jgi:hypothetical protein
MNKNKYTCMTLRLEPQLDQRLTEAAYDRRLTKTDWLRAAIRWGLATQRTPERNGGGK